MATKKDDWSYTRNQGQHFDQGDLDLIAKRFREGAKATEVARELRCSSRNIYIRFAELRGNGRPRTSSKKLPEFVKPKSPPVNREARFYRSNFEPS